MNSSHAIKGIGIGIVSGILLGLLLKLLQALTGIKVYILLLNVDFLPYIGSIQWPEWIEFIFHLIVSCLIGIVFVMIIHRFKLAGMAVWITSFALTMPAFLLYFPLSSLAIKDVPAPHDPSAILLWLLGHLVYGASIPLLYPAIENPKRKNN
ncbi:hypothetical protein [Rossellomorea aquimaris]|jgi:uncharacterized membrane protein YagU involved in acid resistance|uniref:DUF1440 domain-containing protein n=1 Tax=Rossellomorea aquimaris TaxID=189382 RepID=A0A1J6W461_9BACI|nr:hypothetical protein [Rossellomorea aquimaris]OIU72362.1 hypothetical protein BHE18_06970 [Rossellomorea aquimaris]